MKMYSILLAFPLLLTACSDHDDDNIGSVPTEILSPVVNTTGNLTLDMQTDKARYNPGETVRFSVSGTLPSGARVRYRQAGTVVGDEALGSNDWSWTPPQTDFTGYLADIYTADGANAETIYGTIAVDVSSDWTRFPRYGFVADYDESKTEAVIASETAFLNRCHINGIQYYDWHNKHHWPLGGTRTALLDTYLDIANREVVTQVVKNYISAHHNYGMKAMFYNLCYGALDDAAADGVSDKWRLYTNDTHSRMDKITLSSSWKSDIYLTDPANSEWQQYLAQRNDDVYANFDFDGFHIDQVGDRGTVYDYYGSSVNLPRGFASFIDAMKESHPQKRLVMNAVANYGARNIAQTGNVDFLYTELWDGEAQFSDLLRIVQANQAYSDRKLSQVFAAYMNYNQTGEYFNTPGVLLTDAVMFAIGASHLELGDHMLCHEYFANKSLKMTDQLRQAIVSYYDFLTAYENLLRDGGTEYTATLASGNANVSLASWPPKQQTVTVFSRQQARREVVHLLNFLQANSLSWRDMDSTMPEPELVSNLPLRMRAPGVKRVWVASPDSLGGVPQVLNFRQDGGYINFTLPSLKYWTMIVIEK